MLITGSINHRREWLARPECLPEIIASLHRRRSTSPPRLNTLSLSEGSGGSGGCRGRRPPRVEFACNHERSPTATRGRGLPVRALSPHSSSNCRDVKLRPLKISQRMNQVGATERGQCAGKFSLLFISLPLGDALLDYPHAK